MKDWDITNIKGLNDKAEKARDYVMALPDRLQKVSERTIIPKRQHSFKWLMRVELFLSWNYPSDHNCHQLFLLLIGLFLHRKEESTKLS